MVEVRFGGLPDAAPGGVASFPSGKKRQCFFSVFTHSPIVHLGALDNKAVTGARQRDLCMASLGVGVSPLGPWLLPQDAHLHLPTLTRGPADPQVPRWVAGCLACAGRGYTSGLDRHLGVWQPLTGPVGPSAVPPLQNSSFSFSIFPLISEVACDVMGCSQVHGDLQPSLLLSVPPTSL